MGKYCFSEAQRSAMERSPVPFAVYQFLDRRVVTLIVSDGFCELLGYTDREQAYFDMDHNMYRDTHPDDVARIAEVAVRFATEGGEYEAIYRSKDPSGSGYMILHARGRHVFTEDGVRLAYVWYTREGAYVPDELAQETELSRMLNRSLHDESMVRENNFDHLTGLPAMTYFFELAELGRERVLAAGGEPCVLFLDLSGMKFYNREYGFSAGDQLLRSFAQLLARCFGSESCSRFGLDHFAVHTERAGLEETLEQMFRDSAELCGGRTLPIRVGIYVCRNEHLGVSTACDRAKYACDVIRNQRVSSYRFFDDELYQKIRLQKYIIDNLDRAISERMIQIHYQPIVHSVSELVCDEEALSRWIDPEYGLLSPAEFIPVLEDAQLIYKLDLYVVERVLEKMRDIEAAGLPVVPQSVNLSRSDFDACDIVEEIRRRVDDAGFDRALLSIEITESVVGSDPTFMTEQIRRFRSLGFQVWMDDFGSGYSSLDLLQSVEFDLIKFDMRFMKHLDLGKGRIVLSELMRLATALGVDTVCEGVETAEQVRFLREIGCSKLQGFYYGRALAPEVILRSFREGSALRFEDPERAEYYRTVARVNLHDVSAITSTGGTGVGSFFNTIPMGIAEVRGKELRFIRSNQSYRSFSRRFFGVDLSKLGEFTELPPKLGGDFKELLFQCAHNTSRAFFDETFPDGTIVHSFLRRLAIDPVTGTSAVAVAVLSVMGGEQGMTYANIARALAADYFNIFYVDLDTERFIEYSSDVGEHHLALERHGSDFFAAARRDAMHLLYEEDREHFVEVFHKETILRTLDEQGTFTITYRLLQDGKPVYVIMKVMRMDQDRSHIIIGVSGIDTQMRAKEALERARQDRIAYSRILALAGDYICLYTVNPETGHFSEYNATSDYKQLGIPEEGEDFF